MVAMVTDQRQQVIRVRCSRDGMLELAGQAVYGCPCVAELLDGAGEVCGRASKISDPAARYGDGYQWSVQIGGVTVSREWAGRPMGCGSGGSPTEAALRAVDDLRARADALAAQAERAAAMLGLRRIDHAGF